MSHMKCPRCGQWATLQHHCLPAWHVCAEKEPDTYLHQIQVFARDPESAAVTFAELWDARNEMWLVNKHDREVLVTVSAWGPPQPERTFLISGLLGPTYQAREVKRDEG